MSILETAYITIAVVFVGLPFFVLRHRRPINQKCDRKELRRIEIEYGQNHDDGFKQ
jgi:hypothetical protein